jgi:hypothetical protein
MRKAQPKFLVSEARKQHYAILYSFLRKHPEIEFKKLPIGFQINIATIPECLENEFLELATFD